MWSEKNENADKAVIQRVRMIRDQNKPVSGPLIQEKAKCITKKKIYINFFLWSLRFYCIFIHYFLSIFLSSIYANVHLFHWSRFPYWEWRIENLFKLQKYVQYNVTIRSATMRNICAHRVAAVVISRTTMPFQPVIDKTMIHGQVTQMTAIEFMRIHKKYFEKKSLNRKV